MKGESRGFVNAHTHLYSGLAPLGLPQPEPTPENFLQILERVWWRLDRALDASTLRAAARYYLKNALLCGTTSLVDHHESPSCIEGSLDVLADACQELGMRALLCYGATERNRGRDEAQAGLAECRRFLAENDRPLLRGVVGLHASFTVSDDTMREAAELCREFSTVLHVHVAEDIADVEDARRRGAEGPLERLLAFDALPPGSILAHGVHLDASAVGLCRERGLWLVQNPRSNTNNGVGHPAHLAASDRVALGTDGFASDMREELRALQALPMESGEDAEIRRGRLEAGLRLMAERFGSEVGAHDHAVMQRERCRDLIVAGRRVVQDGELLAATVEEIDAQAREAADQLWRSMEDPTSEDG